MSITPPDALIESIPERFGGAPMFKGTDISVYVIAARLARGDAIDLILRKHPGLALAMVEAARRYVEFHPFNRGLVDEPSPASAGLPSGFAEDAGQATLGSYPETAQVQIDAGIMGGTPCIRGTRIPVHGIKAALDGGDTIEMLMDDFVHITEVQIRAAAAYAAAHPIIEATDARPHGKKSAARQEQ
jgi:uncharacterized protein (DUF433 family)